jgi:hypothetical protein
MGSDGPVENAGVDHLEVVTHLKEVQLRWPVWTGSTEDLQPLSSELQRLAEKGCSLDRNSTVFSASTDDSQTEAIDEKWRLQASANYPQLYKTEQGTPEQVLKQLNTKEVRLLQISTKTDWAGRATMRVTFRQYESSWFDDRWGVELYLQSRDHGWVLEAQQALSHAIAQGVPWWAFLRGRFAAILYGMVTAVAAILAFHSLGWFTSILIGEAIGMPAGFGSQWLIRKRFPAFEILQPGSTASGARVVKIIGSLASQLAIGIFLARLIH